MIRLNHLSYNYPDGTKALVDLDLTVNEGEKLVVAGANGAGKSTLFLILNGICRPTGGTYFFEGREVGYSRKALLHLRQNIGLVFQDPDHQIFSSSVWEEVSFGPLNLGLSPREAGQRVEHALTNLDIVNLKDRPVHLLSYGQKKRVTIASVLAMDPKVIIFDEPTSGLDPAHASEMVNLLDMLHAQGRTVILSTHDMNLAYRWGTRMVVLSDGYVAGEGALGTIFSNPALLDASGLELPLILQVHRMLNSHGLPAPATLTELAEQINARL